MTKAKTTPVPSFEYREHTITVDTDRSWKFKIEGPMIMDGGDAWADSFEQAKSKIDAKAAAMRKQKAIKLALPCLDDTGKKVIATGVHAGNGYVLGVGDGDHLYPDIPWVQEALTKLLRLRKESSDLVSLLHPFRIKIKRTYGRMDPAQYDRIAAGFTEEHDRITKDAQRKAPKS